jgi:hypothetical protein
MGGGRQAGIRARPFFLHFAEAHGPRLGAQRGVDGGVRARRRSTPGAHEGGGYGHGQRGRGRLTEGRRL